MKMDYEVIEAKHYQAGEGTVIDYRFVELHVVVYRDSTGENVWGYGETFVDALKMAEEKWSRLIGGENPFTIVLKQEGEWFFKG